LAVRRTCLGELTDAPCGVLIAWDSGAGRFIGGISGVRYDTCTSASRQLQLSRASGRASCFAALGEDSDGALGAIGVAKDRLDSHTTDQLKLRNLALRRLRNGFVQVCADDGSPDGCPIGWAEQVPHSYHRRLAWQTTVRGVPLDDYSYWHGGLAHRARYSPASQHETLGQAIEEILLAQWGDVLAAHEIRSGRVGTYTATMDETQANWLARLDEPKGITHLGGGRIRLTNVAVALFRGSPKIQMYIDANDTFHLSPLDPPVQLTREQ
jgi:hypothetical protein